MSRADGEDVPLDRTAPLKNHLLRAISPETLTETDVQGILKELGDQGHTSLDSLVELGESLKDYLKKNVKQLLGKDRNHFVKYVNVRRT